MTFCVLILLVCWIMVSAPAWAQSVKPGETVTATLVVVRFLSPSVTVRVKVIAPPGTLASGSTALSIVTSGKLS